MVDALESHVCALVTIAFVTAAASEPQLLRRRGDCTAVAAAVHRSGWNAGGERLTSLWRLIVGRRRVSEAGGRPAWGVALSGDTPGIRQ